MLQETAHFILTLVFLLADQGGRGAAGRETDLKGIIYPTGAVAGTTYIGKVLTEPPVEFSKIDSIKAFPFFSAEITNIAISRIENDHFSLECTVVDLARNSERIDVFIFEGDLTRRLELFLRIVGPDWRPDWRPVAVAPEDTAVASDTSAIILDATKSYHPGGRDRMHFKWVIDNATALKGGQIISIRLHQGDHTAVLEAEDDFGNLSYDTMLVTVLHRID